MRTKDWKAIKNAKVLVVGEDSNLQWSETVPEYVMFADYYFRSFPEDHGERSRNVEARNLFDYITWLTAKKVTPEEIYITNLCNDSLEPSPKGKRVFIPQTKALKGIEHIKWILSQNPSIKYILAMSLQTNYWLQKAGFCAANAAFLTAAEPRRKGMENEQPFYQPINGKAFSLICGNRYEIEESPVQVIPILPAKDFPLSEQNIERYKEHYQDLFCFFKGVSF